MSARYRFACDRSRFLRCERRTANYRNACSYLQSAGQKAYNITYQVVISEMIPEPSQMADLTQGLAALERGFGLESWPRPGIAHPHPLTQGR
jgi:hypothetical protein